MERVVPWVPFIAGKQFHVVSERVARFSIAQSTTMPALDRVALEPDG
jgi:hypothetical protein